MEKIVFVKESVIQADLNFVLMRRKNGKNLSAKYSLWFTYQFFLLNWLTQFLTKLTKSKRPSHNTHNIKQYILK